MVARDRIELPTRGFSFLVPKPATKRVWDANLGLQPNGTIPFAPALAPFEHQLVMPLDRDVVAFSSLPGHPTAVP